MALPGPDALAFGDVVIDLAGRRLLRGGVLQPLEPKAFAVLVLLASAPGQAMGRDQILDAVWGHRHITPGVLNRVMTLLRQALGEDAQTPRYLHTLHGMGYRFDLPAAALTAAAPVAAAELVDATPDRQASGSTADDAAEVAVAPAIAATVDTAVDTAVGDADRRAADRRAAPQPPRRWPNRRWLLAPALLFVAALIATGWWMSHRAAPPPPPARASQARTAPTLIVMPLKPIGGGDTDRDIAAGLSDELISALARVDGLQVIARESTGVVAAESTDITALVPKLGISHALEGSLRQSGETLRMHLRLTDARTGRTLWVQDYDRNVVDVLALEREIAVAVAQALTLRLGLPETKAAKGGDASFLLRYQKVRARMRGVHLVEELEKLEAELRELSAERPDDAAVHAALAAVLDSRAYGRPQLATGLRSEALREATLATRLDPTLPEPYYVQAAAACRAYVWEHCLALHRKAGQVDPSSFGPRFSYAMALASLGYLDQAQHVLEEGVSRDPLNKAWYYAQGRLLDTRGEHAKARAAFDHARGFNTYGPWFNAVWRRDYGEAMRIALSMDANPRDPTHGAMLEKTHLAATRALIDPALWPQAIAAGADFERRTGMMDFLRVLHPHPDAAALIAALEQLHRRDYSTWDLLLWSRDLPFIRKDPAFQAYLQRTGILAYWKEHGFPPQCRAEGAGAICE